MIYKYEGSNGSDEKEESNSKSRRILADIAVFMYNTPANNTWRTK
jgi:hypothetical protein